MSIQSDKEVHSYHPQARLSESQAMIEQLQLKLAQMEKAKAKVNQSICLLYFYIKIYLLIDNFVHI